MFSKSLIVSVFLLTLTSSVNVQAAPAPALGIRGNLGRDDIQPPSNRNHERSLKQDIEDAFNIGSFGKAVSTVLSSVDGRDNLEEGRDFAESAVQDFKNAEQTAEDDLSKDFKRYCKSFFFFLILPLVAY